MWKDCRVRQETKNLPKLCFLFVQQMTLSETEAHRNCTNNPCGIATLPNYVAESHISKMPAMPQCHLRTKGLALETLGGTLKLQDFLWISSLYSEKECYVILKTPI